MTTPNPAQVASALTSGKIHLPAASLSRVTPKSREKAAKSGEAMKDGSFPIRDGADLRRAIQAFGRAKDKGAAKRHIIRRARALGKTELLPETWKALAAKEFPGQRPVSEAASLDKLENEVFEALEAPVAPVTAGGEALLTVKAEQSGVPLAKLKMIYRRGIEDFGTRTCVTPDQHAHARVNAFLRTLTASVLPDGYTCKDIDLLPVSHPLVATVDTVAS